MPYKCAELGIANAMFGIVLGAKSCRVALMLFNRRLFFARSFLCVHVLG